MNGEGRGFRELMEYCEPRYAVPSRKHTSKLMFNRFVRGKTLLADKLQSDSFSLALTTDICRSSSTEAFISLTCHFLTYQWEFADCVFAIRSFPDHHTAENISCIIKEELAAYKIADRSVSSIVHDQGPNMRRATDLLQIEKRWT